MANVHTRPRSGFIQRGGARRRDTIWVGAGWAEQNIASGAVLFSSFGATILALRPFTVVRTRGMLLVNSDQTGATERQLGAYGMAIVSEQAVAIGVTAIPTPETDIDSDMWFLYEPFAAMQNFVSGVGISDGYRPQTFDSRAMRKVEDGQDFVEVVELASVSDGCTFQVQFRMLLKLH